LHYVERSQVVEHHRNFRIVETERFLADYQRSPVQWLRIGITTLLLVKHPQIVEQFRNIGMVGTKRFLCDRRDSLCKRDGFGEFTSSV
jgi:hypothetical protein